MSCFKSGRNFGRNFCPNPVNPVPAGFENSKSGAPLSKIDDMVISEFSNNYGISKISAYLQIY